MNTEMKAPEVKFNKNGYEIRTDILAMAKEQVENEFNVKFQGWSMTAQRDEKTGQFLLVMHATFCYQMT